MFNKALLGLFIASALSGCAVKEVCPPGTEVDIPEAEVKAKNSGTQKVIVLPADINFDDPAAKNLKSVVLDKLENQVYSTGMELVDRKLANKLKGEIKLAEESGRYNTSGVPIADYAVITTITSSELSKSFREEYTAEVKDLITGRKRLKTFPAQCTHRVDFKAVAKLVSLPNMKLIDRINLSGSDSNVSETRNSACPINNAGYIGLAAKAAAEAVDDDYTLRKNFAASAYTMVMRTCDAGSMVKISMGKNKKILPKMDVHFMKQAMVDDGSGGTEIETYGYGEGYIVDNHEHGVKENHSWVVIDDEIAPKIHKGDKVKVKAAPCKLLDVACQSRKIDL